MNEERVPIKGYEGRYDITKTGRIYSYYKKEFKSRCGDEYGFHIVKLCKDGKRKNFNVFELWKDTFDKESESTFKGARKKIY